MNSTSKRDSRHPVLVPVAYERPIQQDRARCVSSWFYGSYGAVPNCPAVDPYMYERVTDIRLQLELRGVCHCFRYTSSVKYKTVSIGK